MQVATNPGAGAHWPNPDNTPPQAAPDAQKAPSGDGAPSAGGDAPAASTPTNHGERPVRTLDAWGPADFTPAQFDVHPNSSHGVPSPRVNDTLRYGLPTAPHALTADANSTSNTGAGFSPLKKTKEYAAKIKDKVWDKHVREGAEIKIESERLACKRANAREKRYEEDRQNPQEDGAAVVRDVMGVEVGEAVQLKKNLTSAGKIYGYMTTTPPDCKELLDQENKAPPIDFFKK